AAGHRPQDAAQGVHGVVDADREPVADLGAPGDERDVGRPDETVPYGKERQRRRPRYGAARDADQDQSRGADEKARRDHAFLADELANGADEPILNDGPGQAHHGENVPDRASGGPEAVKRQERRSEEHTSELQSREKLVCRLLLEKKK